MNYRATISSIRYRYTQIAKTLGVDVNGPVSQLFSPSGEQPNNVY